MKAVVMGGGEGTRLRPLTCGRPKPLVPVVNKPVMEHILDLLKAHAITDVVATLYYLADDIVAYFGDGSDYGVTVNYAVEDTPLGTAGSVKQAERHLRDGAFVIISGDALTDIDLTAAYNFHKKKGSMATLILKRVPNPLEYGVVITNKSGLITRFLEKPGWSEVFSDTVNTGIYILEPGIFDYIEPDKNYDFSKDLFPILLREGKPIHGYIADGYWCDIGGLAQYQQAVHDALSQAVKVKLPGREVEPGVWVGEGCEIEAGARILAPSVIGANCRILSGARVGEYSVIGDNCFVESGAHIERSVLWGGNYISANARVFGCTVCYKTVVKQSASIGEAAVVGDSCRLEKGSVVRAGIKIWPDKTVAANSTVTSSLVWGSRWQESLFRGHGATGIANVEITPEFAVKLAAAYGVSLRKGATVVTSRDPRQISRMLKRSVIAGLMSVGVNVVDLRAMPLPIARYATRTSDAAGGIHVRTQPDNAQMSLIEIYDSDGVSLSTADERKIESIFFREDFRRTDPDNLGDMDFGSHALESYAAGFTQAMTPFKNGNRLKIVVDYGFGRLSSVFPAMLAGLDWDIVALNAYVDTKCIPTTRFERQKLQRKIGDVVAALHADAGLFMDTDGERFTLVDEVGSIVDGCSLLTLYASLLAARQPGAKIAVPVTAPTAIDGIVRDAGGDIVRTRADPRMLMAAASSECIALAGDIDGGFVCPEFHPALDAMFACSKMLGMIAATGQSLSSLLSAFPRFCMARELVECHADHKGKVMRVLAEAEHESETDYTDGIKITNEYGWVLALPDPAEPCFHVFAEGVSLTEAQALADECCKRIRDIAA